MAWQYVNIKVPTSVAFMFTNNDIRMLLGLFGITSEWGDASTGSSPFGPYEEGDIWNPDGKVLLSYDFMVDGDTARIFRVNR